MFNICGAARGGLPLAVPRQVVCNPPQEAAITKAMVRVYIKKDKPTTTVAWRCHIVKRTICTHEGFWKGKGLVKDTTETLPATVSACKMALQNFSYNGRMLHQIQTGAWSTNNTLTIDYDWCCYDYCQTVQNFVLEKGTVATLDYKRVFSDLGEMAGCHADTGQCLTVDSLFMWHAPSLNEATCQWRLKGQRVYDATVSDFHVLIDEMQGAFSFQEAQKSGWTAHKPKYCIPTRVGHGPDRDRTGPDRTGPWS
jgi:hypothetical protein